MLVTDQDLNKYLYDKLFKIILIDDRSYYNTGPGMFSQDKAPVEVGLFGCD